MSDGTYRVIVRGTFADLDEAQRAALVESAAEHGLLSAALTDEGTLIHELPLRSSTFRCVVRQPADAKDDPLGGREARDSAEGQETPDQRLLLSTR
ncbi:DUF6204 family protein [Streptomyces sp. NPDC088251]|uniref:DUF6204 family protein n=1 Tax=unclassified Streptomyces TaxID=2593676 RepID=UPI0033D77347